MTRSLPLGTLPCLGLLAALVLAQGEERALALWRRERLREGWSWTIDLVLVPLAHGLPLTACIYPASMDRR